MSNEQQSIGMMQGAFFVPKSDLLNWINASLNLNLTKIQQLGTGAVYCQILDMMFPNKVNLAKVNWKAKNEWQFINNLKILQQGFSKSKIHKHIDIERLSKSKYQDNLEFIQWMKRYYDLYSKAKATEYDPESARKGAEADFSFVEIRSHPLRREKQQVKMRIKSKSPYDYIKSKINNRSVTLEKYPHENSEFYLGKLGQIKDILQKAQKEGEKLQKITEIIDDIKEQLPNPKTLQVSESQIQHLDTVPSKKMISNKKLPAAKKESKISVKMPPPSGKDLKQPLQKKEKKEKLGPVEQKKSKQATEMKVRNEKSQSGIESRRKKP